MPSPNGDELLELARQLERERRCGDDRVDAGDRRQILVEQLRVGVGGERGGERLELVAADRQSRGCAMPAEALEMAGAGGETGMEVEARHRSAGALPAVALAGDQDDRPAESLHEPRGDDPDHALVPALAPDDVGAAAALLGRPRIDDGDRLAEDPLLDGLAVAVQRLELVREQVGLAVVLRQHEMQAHVRPAEPAGGIEPWREPEADGRRIDGGRIDARDAHQRPQPGLLGARERPQAGARERAVLVDERHDIGDRRERDEILVPRDRRMVGSEERLRELDDDAGAAEVGKRVVGGPRGDDRAVRQRVAGTVMVGDDHVDAEPPGLFHLGDGGDAAVDGEDQLHALLGQARDRRRRDAVALLEPARQVPADVGADLPQRQHGERRRADAVDVVVAVDADPLVPLDRRPQALHGRRHVAEEQRIVGDALGLEERPGAVGSPRPRRTSTVASVSETSSAAISSLTSGNATGSTFQLPTMQSR